MKKILLALTALMLGACTTKEPPAPSAPPKETETAVPFEKTDSWSAAVTCDYEMTFANDDKAVYRMEGLIEADEKAQEAHLYQTFYTDGSMSSALTGWYYGGRLYIDYNGVEYYDEMTFTEMKQVMLVPLDGALIPESDREETTADGELITVVLNAGGREKWFTGYYDFYGVSDTEKHSVNKGVIIQRTENGHLAGETADFELNAVLGGMDADIVYHSDAVFSKINSTEIGLNGQIREKTAAYPHYSGIDTESIAEGDLNEEYDSAEDMLKARLTERLGYVLQEDGTYLTEYNENESYRFDFANRQFIYRNRTSTYVYNWRGDTGGFGSSCSYDFAGEKGSSSCTEDVLEMIRNVKLYLQMELYYCGMLLEDLAE